jgi:ankyrin repeat protein
MQLVDENSACLDCHERVPLNVRHSMMNKYRGPEDQSFKLVSGRIKEILEKIHTDRSLTQDEQECMQALSFPYQDQKDMNPERIDGTCEWFLHHQKFVSWRQDIAKTLLWVTAGPGCGKSVLCKALVDKGLLHPENPETETTSICYFFFKDDPEQGSGINALCSILHQLFKQKPWLIQHAVSEYKISGPKLPFGTLWNTLMEAATDPNAGPIICVFDALDECESVSRLSLIKKISYFHRTSDTSGSKLKFIVTSRPYHELQMVFDVGDLPSIHLEGNEMSKEIGEEVNLVISSEITRIGNRHQPPLNKKIQANLIQYLSEQNNRTYLWVYLMLKEVEKSLESTERKFTQLVKALPRSVEEVYQKILNRATDPAQAKRVLRLVLAAERPLSWKEMNTALAILDMKEKGEKCDLECDLELDSREAFVKKIENLCGLFVTVVDGKIYLIHQTAKEFLVKNSGDPNSWSPSCWKHTFTPEASHLEVSRACIWYLQLDFLQPDHEDFEDFALRLYYQHMEDDTFLPYASKNWTLHYRQAGQKADRALEENALRLCETASKKFLLWFDIIMLFVQAPHVPKLSSDLTVACYFGLATAVQLLIEGKSDVKIDFKDNIAERTPLSWAAENGHKTVVKLLLKTEMVDVNLGDKDGRTPLLFAAKNGHEAVVKLLLEMEKVDVNLGDKDGRTPLLFAAQNGHEAVVKLLLEMEKVDVNLGDKHQQTPLLLAAKYRHEAVVKLLLKTDKADVNLRDTDGRTPLLWAAGNDHEAVVKLLLESNKVDVNLRDTDGRTPLSWAAAMGHVGAVKLLLKIDKVDGNLRDIDGGTPLSWAAENGQEVVVKLLLETDKVDVNLGDKDGRTPLLFAAQNGHEAVVKLLLEMEKVDVNLGDKHQQTPLLLAAKYRHEAVVKLLLKTDKADVNLRDTDGRTPLWCAAARGYKAEVELLLESNKVDVNLRDTDGQTPLSWAARIGYKTVVKLLLKMDKVDVNLRGTDGRTPLSWAAGNDHEAVVKLLLESNKVDVNLRDTDGRTPLSWAAAMGHVGAVKLLLKIDKVDGNLRDIDGGTPLSWAAENGQEVVVKLLLETDKVDVNVGDKYGRTPLLLAAQNGHEAVVKLLLETGKVDVNSRDTTLHGKTPLSWAAKDGHEAVVKLLLKMHQINVNLRDTLYQQTALSLAAENGQEVVVKLLLETDKVDVNLGDKYGRTPLLFAAKNGHEAVVKLLLEMDKVDVDSRDTTQHKQTPLWWAARTGHTAVVKLLLATGKADIKLALESGHEAVVKLLREMGKISDQPPA